MDRKGSITWIYTAHLPPWSICKMGKWNHLLQQTLSVLPFISSENEKRGKYQFHHRLASQFVWKMDIGENMTSIYRIGSPLLSVRKLENTKNFTSNEHDQFRSRYLHHEGKFLHYRILYISRKCKYCFIKVLIFFSQYELITFW